MQEERNCNCGCEYSNTSNGILGGCSDCSILFFIIIFLLLFSNCGCGCSGR